MAGKRSVLVEVRKRLPEAFGFAAQAAVAPGAAVAAGEEIVGDLAGFGLEVRDDYGPIPLFGAPKIGKIQHESLGFSVPAAADDMASESIVVPCEVEASKIEDLEARRDVTVWPNSELELLACRHCGRNGRAVRGADPGPLRTPPPKASAFDLAQSAGGLDCFPFLPAVSIDTIRRLLGVSAVWRDGFRGQNIVVGIIDEGIDGRVYPVVGGFTRSRGRQPGAAPIDSHGSMCAADVLVAAPWAKLYDYPFLGVPDSGGALTMFQEILNQRRKDGTPHLTNNSYGFVAVPPKELAPKSEIWDSNHPIHRKVREVVASGCPCFFAAGNCGAECPSGACNPSSVGPGKSIHGSNSLEEVITVAAVNSRHQRIGYSSQGPGMFLPRKPDIASYAHFFGNFGPDRPAGGDKSRFDNGTSAATPVAAGVAALLMSALPGLSPAQIKAALIGAAVNIGPPGWDADTGHGVLNAGAAYASLKRVLATPAPAAESPTSRRPTPPEFVGAMSMAAVDASIVPELVPATATGVPPSRRTSRKRS